MRPSQWNTLVAGLLLTPIPYIGHAETYLTEDQAAAVLFPGVKLEARWMELTPAEIKTITKMSGEKPLSSRTRVFWGPDHEALFIDRVLGKHEFITYAAAINADGTVKGIEIMDYRETYGYQVREAAWREKFVGKSTADPLQLDKDIPNISGATLSSKHIANGMRRLLHTYALLKTRL